MVFLLGVLLYNSHQVLANHLKIGELMAILGLCSNLLPSIANLALISIPINEAKIAFDRMFEFTGLTPELDKDTINLYHFEALRLENVLFKVRWKIPIIKRYFF